MSNVNILKQNDPCYPSVLTHIDRPPKQLFYIGSNPSEWIEKPKVAIVGSRKASSYGKAVTEDIAGKLARAGVVIISGLAYGIDAAAHQAAIKAGGTTVAVLATPVTKIYPAGHRQLAGRIIDTGGSLISECENDAGVYKASFLERNRIISGLADLVIITEAAVRSGSLNTARFALEQGKTVMAVPGNITNVNSVGCNNLIKSGALPLTEVEDVFFALGIKPTYRTATQNFRGTPEEELILELIRNGITSQEELAVVSKIDGPAFNSALTMLEISGIVRAHGAGEWTLV